MIKDFMRPVSMYQALNLETPSGHEGFVIRARRLRFGLSQEAFAKLAGVDRGRLSRIEHGHAKMSPLFRTKLFQAFNKLEMSGHGKTQLPTRIRRRV
jgi:DNA-binding XRE family transcriptional regulator